MAKKKRYCPHKPHDFVINVSKSSKLICCKNCFDLEIKKQKEERRKEMIEYHGLEFVNKLDYLKSKEFKEGLDKMWGEMERKQKLELENYLSRFKRL